MDRIFLMIYIMIPTSRVDLIATSKSVTPECRVAESRRVGKLLTSIIILIGSNNAAARLKL